jgi:hypothetical protein
MHLPPPPTPLLPPRFLLPPYFPLVIRSVASLEGIALSVDPDFKLISAGMPIVLNQLLRDRRPAAEALLRELLLAPGGALRSDATSQQILQVWVAATAAEQRQAREAAAAAAEADATSTLDLTGLLLDRRNAPLRRVLLDVNPAATVAAMPADLRRQLKAAVVGLATGGGLRVFGRGRGGWVQRKRLLLLFKVSLGKVAASPWRSVLQLISFTVAVAVAVLAARAKQLIGGVFRGRGGVAVQPIPGLA